MKRAGILVIPLDVNDTGRAATAATAAATTAVSVPTVTGVRAVTTFNRATVEHDTATAAATFEVTT